MNWAVFPHVESYIIGGLIRPGYFSVGESLALEMINAFSVERAFISCDALSLETGITNATMFEVGVKTRIIQRSREVILMADHSKFDAVEPHAVATLSCIKTIISDSGLPETIAQRYQRAGCQLFFTSFNKVISKFIREGFQAKNNQWHPIENIGDALERIKKL